MQERCFYCQDENLICQKPSVPLIQGRWELSSDGQKVNLNPEKMERCHKRIAILSRTEETLHIEEFPGGLVL